MDTIRPEGWPRPTGYSDGIRVDAGCRLLFVAGQVGWNERQRIVPGGFAAQFAQALRNVVAVVEAAGGRAEHLVRMTVYVTDLEAYRLSRSEAGAAWKSLIG